MELHSALPQFIFETASQGEEGVNKIKEALKQGIHYSLAFVDIRMPPGWNGIETINHMWEVDPDIQVVICTAYSDFSWEETVNKLGFGDNYLILKKPFDLVAVRQLAFALTKKWILAKDYKNNTQLLEKTVREKTISLQESLSLLRSTIESYADGVLVFDLQKQLIDWNCKFEGMWGIPKDLLQAKNGQGILDYMINQVAKPEVVTEQFNRFDEQVDESGWETIALKNGEILECTSHPHRMNDITTGRVWSFRNITERVIIEQKLEYQASHDLLTGLPNRVLLTDRIINCIEVAKRHHQIFRSSLFDLNRFKLVNDSLGHEFGDELLCSVASRLTSIVRKEDTVARLGGDEFVMLIPELNDDESALIGLSNKILKSFSVPFHVSQRNLTIFSSIGISIYPRDGDNVSALLKNADLAMYHAKAQGGNQFQFYTGTLNDQANNRFNLEIELRNAIESNEFVLHYQPQFDMDKKNLLSAEALIRWNHPQRGILFPIDFIFAAEESALIIPIGEWVIREACRQIIAWQKAGLPMSESQSMWPPYN